MAFVCSLRRRSRRPTYLTVYCVAARRLVSTLRGKEVDAGSISRNSGNAWLVKSLCRCWTGIRRRTPTDRLSRADRKDYLLRPASQLATKKVAAGDSND